MKIGMRSLRFFILLFAASSLLFHPPSDFEAFAVTSDATIDSTVQIDENDTPFFPELDNNDYFGISVANIGDLDGDGVNDLAVGASHDGGNERGAVYIMFMNIDGSVDSIVENNSTNITNISLAKNDHFGISVANIGDLNGDGVNDLAVGASGDECGSPNNNNRGAVHILFMNTDGSVKDSSVEINCTTTNGPVLASKEGFGVSVANIGDLDGDGVNDLAVGATHWAAGNPATFRGALFIMFMTDEGDVKSTVDHDEITGNLVLGDDDYFGRSVANIGDLDGDGVNDLAVGATRDDTGVDENGELTSATYRGAVYIMFMNIDGTAKDSSVEINDYTTYGPVLGDNDKFGSSVANLGDLDGDGVNDLAVGAIGDDEGCSDCGAVHIMFMNIDGTPKSTVEINQTTTNGPNSDPNSLTSHDIFGSSVANIGDFDGNGVIDLAVGAAGSAGGNNNKRGAMYIIFLHMEMLP